MIHRKWIISRCGWLRTYKHKHYQRIFWSRVYQWFFKSKTAQRQILITLLSKHLKWKRNEKDKLWSTRESCSAEKILVMSRNTRCYEFKWNRQTEMLSRVLCSRWWRSDRLLAFSVCTLHTHFGLIDRARVRMLNNSNHWHI